MKRSHKKILLILILLIAALILSGCGGVDPETGEYNPGIFEFLAAPLRQAVILFNGWFDTIGVNYSWGWAIIMVATVIRLLLLPLSLKQMRSMREAQAKTKALQPEIDRLKKKYGKDKQRFQQEQMKLYQEHKVTQAQMAGCLPTVIQMPILFAFYYALIGLAAAEEKYISGEPFYWIPDISLPEYRTGLSWLTTDFTLEKLTQPDVWPYLVLPALLAITQYVMIKTGSTGQPQPTSGDNSNPAAGMMGQMSILMTGMFVFFALQVPAGLSLYWVVGNILALLQQVYVNRQQGKWEEEFELTPVLATSGAAASSNSASVGEITDGSTEKAITQSVPKTPKKTSGTRRKRRKRR